MSTPTFAQANSNQFGAQSRANAISQMTVLAVQQGISSLPPTSGQPLVYEFSFEEEQAPVLTPHLGPTVFRLPQTIDKGTLALRLGVSYFQMAETFGPIQYLVQFDRPNPAGAVAVVGLGSTADVHATVMNLSASYGLPSWREGAGGLEVMFNLPVTVVQASASQIASTQRSLTGTPSNMAFVHGAFLSDPLPSDPKAAATNVRLMRTAFKAFLRPDCSLGTSCLSYRTDSFDALGFNFNDGTHPGIGRMSLGGKAFLYSNKWVDLAFMTEFFVPSPNEADFAGPDSAAILPRGVAAVPIVDWLHFSADIGYDYDFEQSALRRLTWTTGFSAPLERASIDVGVSGSEYDTPIHWTPSVTYGMAGGVPVSTLTALENNQLGADFIDVIGGLKLRVAPHWLLSGAVVVPVTNDGFRPAALGTVALEYHVPGI